MPQLPRKGLLAFLSDVHGNIDALDAVLADIKQWPCRAVICLGDIVGYGPAPAACVQEVMESCRITVRGNHESLLEQLSTEESRQWSPVVRRPLEIADSQLDEPQRKWLEGLPLTGAIGSDVSFSHASLSDPADYHYIHDYEEAAEHFRVQRTPVSFHGHTHVPVIWEQNANDIRVTPAPAKSFHLSAKGRYAINVGSVGQPRDDEPRACYVLFDPEMRLVIYRRVSYDLDRALERFRQADLPAFNASRLLTGV